MRVLILTDETYEALAGVWKGADGTPLASVEAPPKLPKAEELHALARNGSEPEAFAQVRERQAAAALASDRVREQMHKLVLDAHKMGIGPTKLAAWSGYHVRRIHQIIK